MAMSAHRTENLADLLDELVELVETFGLCHPDCDDCQWWPITLEQSRAAIAAARGEEVKP